MSATRPIGVSRYVAPIECAASAMTIGRPSIACRSFAGTNWLALSASAAKSAS